MARPWLLSEVTWKNVKGAPYEVAVLPWGATEAHNYHLPYSTDVIESERVAEEAARHAWEQGARVIVLPAVPFGVNTGQLDIPFCINMNPATQSLVLRDVATSLAPHGVRKLVVLNGHGGNDFRQMIRELQPQVPLLICTINWWNCVDPRPFFDEPGDHAGELETSVMLHLAPELVLPLSEAGRGNARQFRIRGLREAGPGLRVSGRKSPTIPEPGIPLLRRAQRVRRSSPRCLSELRAFLSSSLLQASTTCMNRCWMLDTGCWMPSSIQYLASRI